MTISKLLIPLIFVSLGFFFGYVIKNLDKRSPEETKLSLEPSQEVIQELPKCFAGICPLYYAMDVDGDGNEESAVVIPTAMSQGWGKIWIIKDNNKVIFDSGEKMRIFLYQTKKQIEDGNGFILQYGTEVNSTNGVEIKYIYKDGQFQPNDEPETK